ncbi:SusC/RagA family TonB-linked outer membrane protein [Parabacteroides sp. HGS0025]|uniref:SusC/RagA family TonB-linked outer membrane protein n=1 Tax=Parabacteroides sp. HGS0025 TaxID=1078087 RepID=UPI00061705F1|nr:SusC/RagA family TonB-linked outer membrane protein [Parabacteroides sp. HGS0025]KKB47833.1 SusC/RagA family TonB-linked outer membrane protein [Parabacteroides sp. HGS0025]
MKKAIQSISFRDTVYVSTFCLLLSAFPTNAKEVNSYNSEVLPVTNITQQNKTVTGTVVDTNGIPIIGANVVVKGTTHGNITDADGKFTIENVPENTILQISYIGYKTLDVAVRNKSKVEVTLEEDSENLQEVIVVGYGSTVKKDLTTAVTSVKSKDFLQGASNSPLQMIDGKVAGVSVSNTAAADPNASPSIQVRGASSLKAGNGPLIVIDGMPGGDLRNLAQQDIESITVLKDGSAAAIYGSRGANGVILVQTKQGKAGKVSITYDGYAEHDFVAARPEILSPEEFVANNIGKDYGSRTNWYDELLNKNNFGQNHNLALSGGSESTIFRISANYRSKEGLDIATDRKEYGLRASFKQTTLEGLLEVTGNISYRYADEDYTDYGSFKQAVELNPTYSKDEMDAFRNNFDSYNPIFNLTRRENGATQEYLTTDFNIKLNILKNLNTELKLGRQGHDKKQREYYFKDHRESINNSRNGRARLENEKWVDYTLEWLGNYSLDIDQHHLKVMGGYSYQEFNWEKFNAENMNFPTDAFLYNNLGAGDYNKADGRLGMESDKNKEKTIAFLGRVNYDFDNTFLFTGSIRYEGNTKFGTDHKWGAFPAASAAWRVSRLSFFEDSQTVNDLKLRFSYGQTGRSGFDKYISLAKYTGYGWMPNSEGKWVQVYGPGNNPNRDLSWEKQISYNLGIDYTLFNSRLSGSLDLFIREGKDVIGEYQVPVPPYLHEKIMTNVGTTSSKGFELQINWDAVQTDKFTYSTNATLAYTKSKLKSFSNEKYELGYMEGDGLPSPGNPGPCQRLQDGIEIGSFYGYRYAGVDEDGNIMVYKGGEKGGETLRGRDAGEADRTYIGNGTPKWEMAWGNTFTYKGFDLSLYFRGRFDYQILNQYQMYYGLQGVTGINKLTSAYKENAHIKGEKIMCDYFLENGNYLKLDNITLGWTPKLNTKWISNLRIYATMKNVFTITKYSGGMDPSSVDVTGLWAGRGSMDLYPTARNVSFGVQISY